MASNTSGRTGVVAALSRYVRRLVMEAAIYQLDGLHAKREHVVDFLRLCGIEGLAIAPADQRSVVRGLHADQLVQVLAGGKHFARSLGAVELGRVTANRLHLFLEHIRDVYDECGLDRVLSIGEGIQELVRPVRLAALSRHVLGEPGEITGVPSQLRCDAVIRMAADG